MNLSSWLDSVSDSTVSIMQGIGSEKINRIPAAIVEQLKGKGLTVRQAEVLLDYTKDLLKDTTL